jgi:NAD(P)H-quinone oxidoreductase subunit 4
MDVNLPLLAASGLALPAGDRAFPWLSLIVLLPAAVALLMPLLPGDGSDPKWPRALALGALGVDLALPLAWSGPWPPMAYRRLWCSSPAWSRCSR